MARETVELSDGKNVEIGAVPDELVPDEDEFARWWDLHPAEQPVITMYGRQIPVPRYHRAYLRDYEFPGAVAEVAPMEDAFAPVVAWAQENLDRRLNGLLVNWYDAAEGHYIGPHNDKAGPLVEGGPIVTVSFGSTRTFRLTRKGWQRRDVPMTSGSFVMMPWDVNRDWKHEIVKSKKSETGRRISLTLRCFA